VAGAAVPLAGYAQFVEPYHLTVERLDLSIPNLPAAFDGFRIAQLSDFHYGVYTGAAVVSAAVDLANSLYPDLIVITGDFITMPDESALPVTDRVFTDMALCAELLAGLKAPSGVFACLGNHDADFNSKYVTEVLTSFGITVLVNANQPIQRAGARFWLAGLDDHLAGKPSFRRTLAGVPVSEIVVLLVHEPDVADEAARYPIALQLSGHSHGGQVRLPLVDRLCLPPQARKYPYGYYRIDNMHLYTNRGIGTIVLPYRFNAPPEVTLLTLRRRPSTP
jgi:predicted MPP superfamily phosphohydrolase